MRASRHGLLLPAAVMLIGCVSRPLSDAPRAVVSYTDLDLRVPGDRERLSRRIAGESLRYCRERAVRRQLPPRFAEAHPADCIDPTRRAIIDAAPPAVRAALR